MSLGRKAAWQCVFFVLYCYHHRMTSQMLIRWLFTRPTFALMRLQFDARLIKFTYRSKYMTSALLAGKLMAVQCWLIATTIIVLTALISDKHETANEPQWNVLDRPPMLRVKAMNCAWSRCFCLCLGRILCAWFPFRRSVFTSKIKSEIRKRKVVECSQHRKPPFPLLPHNRPSSIACACLAF